MSAPVKLMIVDDEPHLRSSLTFWFKEEGYDVLSAGSGRGALAILMREAPQILLLDEPSTGLDPLARRSLRALLRELAGGGTTVLLTTHLFDEAEEAGRIGILDRGRLVALVTPSGLSREEAAAIPERVQAVVMSALTDQSFR